MNPNSAESYRKCIEEGLISRKNKHIMMQFKILGPTTAGHISKFVPGAWKNIYLLVNMGALEPVNVVYDPYTKRKVTQYRIPDPFPETLRVPARHKMSKAQAAAFLEGARRFKELMDNQMSVPEALRLIQQEAE